MTTQTFSIGTFTVDPAEHSICDGSGHKDVLQPKFIEVLCYLANQYPRLVNRQEIIDAVWDGNNYVGDKALTNAVWHLRKSLACEDTQYIETIRKSGYRLLKPPFFQPTDSVKSGISSPTGKSKHVIWLTSLVAILGIFTVFKEWPSSPEVTLTKQVELVASNPGRELFPAVSPDGRHMVYYWKPLSQSPDLYLKDLAQPDLPSVQLTFDSHRESRPVWGSSDTVYYVQRSWERDRCSIVRLDIATLNQTEVGQCRATVAGALSISSDRKTLVYTGVDDENSSVGLYTLALTEPNAIPERFSCASDCGYSDREGHLSPNNQYMAVIRRSQLFEEDVFIVNVASGESRRLTLGMTNVQGLTWHSSGKHIIASVEHARVRNGYLINIETGDMQNLEVPGFSYPHFVPDQGHVLFHDWRTTEFVASLPLEEQVQSVPFPVIQSGFHHHSADYSEARNQIVYISNESGVNELWIADSNGGDRRKVTDIKSNIFYPRWSNNGQYVAFLVRHPGSERNTIRLLNADTGQVQQLENRFVRFRAPTWSTDDESLLVPAYDEDSYALYALPISGGESRKLVDASVSLAVQSADGALWYSVVDRGLYRQFYMDRQESAVKVLDHSQMASVSSWAIFNNGVLFLQILHDHQQVNYFDETGGLSTVLKAPTRTFNRTAKFDYMADQKRLLFTQSTMPKVDIKLLSHPLISELR